MESKTKVLTNLQFKIDKIILSALNLVKTFWVVVRTQRYQMWRRAQPEESWHEVPYGLHRSFTLPAHPTYHDDGTSPRISGYSQKLRQKRMRSVIGCQAVTCVCVCGHKPFHSYKLCINFLNSLCFGFGNFVC